MKIKIEKGIARGTVCAPPSKSMAHRLLICAGLSDGECVVRGISDSEDMLATMDCLRALGVQCEKDGETVRVSGIDIRKAAAPKQLQRKRQHASLFHPDCAYDGNGNSACRKQEADGAAA